MALEADLMSNDARDEEEYRIRGTIHRALVQALRSQSVSSPMTPTRGVASQLWWVALTPWAEEARVALAAVGLGDWRVTSVKARVVDVPHLIGFIGVGLDIILTVDLVNRASGRGLSHAMSVRTAIALADPDPGRQAGPTVAAASPPDHAVEELVALAREGQPAAFAELARLLMPVEEVEACWQGTRARLGFTDAPAQIPLANAGRVCHTEEGAPG